MSVQLPVDKDCTCENGVEGKCKLLKECSFVYREVLQGHIPSKTCGFYGLDPIVCCPNVDTKSDYHLPLAATASSPTKHQNPFLSNTYLPPYEQSRVTSTIKPPCPVDDVTPDPKVFYPTESSSIFPDDSAGEIPIALFSRVDTDEPETRNSTTSTTDAEIQKNIDGLMKKLYTIQDKISQVKMKGSANDDRVPARFAAVESKRPGTIAQESMRASGKK